MKLQLLQPRTGVRSRPLSSAPASGRVPPANNAINNAALKTRVQSLKKIIRFLYHNRRDENKITHDGIFLTYNRVYYNYVYRISCVLFDKSDPTNVVARARETIFEPVHDWEKGGQVPNVVFVEGLVRDGRRWLFYYRVLGVQEFAFIDFRDSPASHQAYLQGSTFAAWELMLVVRSYREDVSAVSRHLGWPEAAVRATINCAEAFREEIDEAIG